MILESWFVSIKIFINLSGSYWVGNLIKFGSFLLRGWGDEAVTGKFATSLLVFFHQTNLPAHRSKTEHIKLRNLNFQQWMIWVAGKSKTERCTYRLKEILTILIWIEIWSHNICCYCHSDSQTIRTSIVLSAFRADNKLP